MGIFNDEFTEDTDYDIKDKLTWVVIKILHDGTTHVYCVCHNMEKALEMVTLLKDNRYINHALCYQVPYYGIEYKK